MRSNKAVGPPVPTHPASYTCTHGVPDCMHDGMACIPPPPAQADVDSLQQQQLAVRVEHERIQGEVDALVRRQEEQAREMEAWLGQEQQQLARTRSRVEADEARWVCGRGGGLSVGRVKGRRGGAALLVLLLVHYLVFCARERGRSVVVYVCLQPLSNP